MSYTPDQMRRQADSLDKVRNPTTFAMLREGAAAIERVTKLERVIVHLGTPEYWGDDDEGIYDSPDEFANSASFEEGDIIELTPYRALSGPQQFTVTEDRGAFIAVPLVAPVDLEVAGQLRLEPK